jgi:hypothetical protein
MHGVPPFGSGHLSKRGDESVADVGQVEAARAVAATALDEMLRDVSETDIVFAHSCALIEVLGRLTVLAPEQTYVAIQATREGLS